MKYRSGFVYALWITIFIWIGFSLVGCGGKQPPATKKVAQSQKAKKAAESISFTENAEIENIKRRLQLTSNPGLTGFVLLLNEMGQPIFYTGVKGKITSGGKRLTAPEGCRKGSKIDPLYCYDQDTVTAAPSDEGTWGSSNPYIYFWTATGQYIQWNGKYLYSDKPFRLKIEPLVAEVRQAINKK